MIDIKKSFDINGIFGLGRENILLNYSALMYFIWNNPFYIRD